MTAAVLTIATTGPIATKADNPALPTTPQEIADAAHAAYLAGAAVAHIHVRDENGRPTADKWCSLLPELSLPRARPWWSVSHLIQVTRLLHSSETRKPRTSRMKCCSSSLYSDIKLSTTLHTWIRQLVSSVLSERIRQTVILTVGAAWSAEYEIAAHTPPARAAGLFDQAIEAILAGDRSPELPADASVAYRTTRALLSDHAVSDDLYDEAASVLGESGLMAFLCLTGQYETISAILTCFQVPIPSRAPPP